MSWSSLADALSVLRAESFRESVYFPLEEMSILVEDFRPRRDGSVRLDDEDVSDLEEPASSTISSTSANLLLARHFALCPVHPLGGWRPRSKCASLGSVLGSHQSLLFFPCDQGRVRDFSRPLFWPWERSSAVG